MSTATVPAEERRPLDPLAAALSYLLPGLGQIYQGRVAKGVLFLIALHVLFFYGMYMGHWQNVFLPEAKDLPAVHLLPFRGDNAVELRGPFKAVSYRLQFAAQFWMGVSAWPAIYQYINYDEHKDGDPIFGKFERPLQEKELNDLQRDSNKRWDLGWVYTVIAGVLNVLVIYDALAGPAFAATRKSEEPLS